MKKKNNKFYKIELPMLILERIVKISQKYNLKILEDVCQAHGSLYKGKKLGTFGDVSVFSFNPHKTISTLGNGGAINFNQKQFRERQKSGCFFMVKDRYQNDTVVYEKG